MTLDIDSGCKTHLRGQENTFPVILPPFGHFRRRDSPLKICRFGRLVTRRFCQFPLCEIEPYKNRQKNRRKLFFFKTYPMLPPMSGEENNRNLSLFRPQKGNHLWYGSAPKTPGLLLTRHWRTEETQERLKKAPKLWQD